jgi:antitoxin component of MazEF toxin-antitoxin module
LVQVFEGKVRKLGNSMAVIIPNEVLSEAGVREGDVLKLAIPVPVARRKRVWRKVAGIDAGLPSFAREKHDRADGW